MEQSPNPSKPTSTPLEQSLELKQMVAYQPGAVVSRTIMDKGIDTVTVFAFDTGQGLSEHTSPFDALVHILDGEAQITIQGQSQVVKSGEIIIMPANKPHALQALQNFKMMLIMIRKKSE